jgi:cyclopropane-fatty-acyl-phospholipid synthase
MSLESLFHRLVGPDAPLRLESYDGTTYGPQDAPATLHLRSPAALHHLLRAPGELGFARAYVSGELDVSGDIWAVLALRDRLPDVKLSARDLADLCRLVGVEPWRHPPARPAEEIDLGPRWRAHSRRRDQKAIAHHYDVGNDFYRLVLGPSLTYSCAVFSSPEDSLEQAQLNKHELICTKLGLEPGMRMLDVGCGWGSLVLHAAARHGVEAVGITLSAEQATLARRRVIEAGLGGRVEIRVQDYRDLAGEWFDAIASVGMFEHVGAAGMRRYLETLGAMLPPHGRLLNHQIARPAGPWKHRRHERAAVARNGFINRYVFPDGALHEVGDLVESMHRCGLEVRHLESLREHYALTLRHWVANLEAGWARAVALTSEGRARVWRLYMAGSAMLFEAGATQIHQVLATRPAPNGRSGMPLRPEFRVDGVAAAI